jgi:hypothetical protein
MTRNSLGGIEGTGGISACSCLDLDASCVSEEFCFSFKRERREDDGLDAGEGSRVEEVLPGIKSGVAWPVAERVCGRGRSIETAR